MFGCQPEKTTLHAGQSRSWFAEQGKKEEKKKSGTEPPYPPRYSFGENTTKNTRRIYMPRRYAGLGPYKDVFDSSARLMIKGVAIVYSNCLEERIFGGSYRSYIALQQTWEI